MSNHHDDDAYIPESKRTVAEETGPKPEIVEYPKMLYNKDGAQRIVQNAKEAEKLGADWSETPPAAKE